MGEASIGIIDMRAIRYITLLACAVMVQEVVGCGVNNRCVTPIIKKHIVSDSYITNNGK